MVDIIVERAPGDKQGPDIVDALISTVPVAVERGRVEIDKASDLQPMTITSLYISGVRPGMLVEVHDALQGRSWRGKITGVRHILQGNVVMTELQTLRPNEYISYP